MRSTENLSHGLPQNIQWSLVAWLPHFLMSYVPFFALLYVVFDIIVPSTCQTLQIISLCDLIWDIYMMDPSAPVRCTVP